MKTIKIEHKGKPYRIEIKPILDADSNYDQMVHVFENWKPKSLPICGTSFKTEYFDHEVKQFARRGIDSYLKNDSSWLVGHETPKVKAGIPDECLPTVVTGTYSEQLDVLTNSAIKTIARIIGLSGTMNAGRQIINTERWGILSINENGHLISESVFQFPMVSLCEIADHLLEKYGK